jgi:hypothetical protein
MVLGSCVSGAIVAGSVGHWVAVATVGLIATVVGVATYNVMDRMAAAFFSFRVAAYVLCFALFQVPLIPIQAWPPISEHVCFICTK